MTIITDDGTVCPQCGLKNTVKKENKRANGKVSITYACRNPDCMYKFVEKQIKTATKGKKHVTGRTSVFLDKAREAKLPGKRIVKHYDDDGKLVKESVYYERRRNRADIDPKRRL